MTEVQGPRIGQRDCFALQYTSTELISDFKDYLLERIQLNAGYEGLLVYFNSSFAEGRIVVAATLAISSIK